MSLTLCLPRSPICTSVNVPRSPICTVIHTPIWFIRIAQWSDYHCFWFALSACVINLHFLEFSIQFTGKKIQRVDHSTSKCRPNSSVTPKNVAHGDLYLANKELKGKFSSGIEGTLTSTLNHNFNWKQLSEIILCIFLLMLSKFIRVTLIQKQQKYK